MKNLQNIKNVYFLGIGGIGMSALARYFKFTGRNVAVTTKHRQLLQRQCKKKELMFILKTISETSPKTGIRPKHWLFYSGAARRPQRTFLVQGKPIGLLKRAKVLGLICNEQSGIAVSGTHGKTTVSTITATILNERRQAAGHFWEECLKISGPICCSKRRFTLDCCRSR